MQKSQTAASIPALDGQSLQTITESLQLQINSIGASYVPTVQEITTTTLIESFEMGYSVDSLDVQNILILDGGWLII